MSHDLACVIARQNRASEAVSWLRRAVESGYGDPKGFAEDVDLASIRGERGFEAIAAAARSNAEKAAPAR